MADTDPVAASIPPNKITNEPRRLAAEGIRHLDRNELDKALESFNKALYLDGGNSMLNFLAGLTYHLQALAGADAKYDLARQGYQRAIRLDHSNWIAHYHAGLLELDLHDYAAARDHFAEALILNPTDRDLLYSMATASYYVGDLRTAEGVLRQLRRLEPNSDRADRASAITLAALGKPDEAWDYVGPLLKREPKSRTQQLLRRIQDWRAFHARHEVLVAQRGPRGPLGRRRPATNDSSPSSDAPASSQPGWEDTNPRAPGAPKAAPTTKVETEDSSGATAGSDNEAAKPDENQMVIVDVVIIRTEENATTSKGVNLLSSLTLEFGSNNLSTAGISLQDNRPKTTASLTRTITKAINIPSITYSLNIANTADTRDEILARPTLTAMNGQKSEFFSGVSIKAQTLPSTAGGTGEAVSIEQDVGVKLIITPTILDDGRVTIAVEAERTFLNTPDSAITGYTSKIETSRTTVTASVTMNYGETLILSGLSEKETELTRDGVPILQDVPVLQYLFSNKTTTDFNKSVLLLLTPRRPEYIFQGPNAAKSGRSGATAVDEFQARYADWFRPYPSWASVFKHLQDNSLYREFRTGDVTLERWETNISLKSRLRQALGFLYY